MATNFVQPGNTISFPAEAAIASGDVVVTGGLHGVALGAAAIGATVDVSLAGVYQLPKVSANVFTVGAAVYWDSASKLATTTASGNTLLGHAVAAAGNGAASVKVRLAN